MSLKPTLKTNAYGFTLLELSVVLAIIGVIIAGGLTILVGSLNASRYNETVKRMTFIHDTIYNYVIVNGRLPCPANLAAPPTDATYGWEAGNDGQSCVTASTPTSWSLIANENDSFTVPANSAVRYGDGSSWVYKTISGSATCSNGYFGSDPISGTYKHCYIGTGSGAVASFNSGVSAEGALPVRSLKIPDNYMYDAWGRHFRYAVDGSYTISKATAGSSTPGICGAPSNLTVLDAAGVARTSSAAYVLLSHGTNGHGAYLNSGATLNQSSDNLDELKNCHCDNTSAATTYDATYVEKLPTDDVADLADSFDDIVTFRELNQLKSLNAPSSQCLVIQGIYTSGQDRSAYIDNLQFIPSTGFVNPGFESPFLTHGNYLYGAVPGWNAPGVTNNASGFTASNSDAPDGQQVLFIQGGPISASQSISPGAGNYTLQFYASNRMNSGGDPEDFNVLVDGTIIAHYTVTTGTYTSFTTPQFSLTDGAHTVMFTTLNSGAYADVAVFIDSVKIVASGANLNALDSLNAAIDGSFETPQVAAASISAPAASSWHFFQSYIIGNGSAYNSPDAPAGNQQVVVQNDGSVSHAVALPSGSYQLKFITLNRSWGDIQTLSIYIDGKKIGTVTPLQSGSAYNYYNQYITDPFVIP